jgi:hypothetical protein
LDVFKRFDHDAGPQLNACKDSKYSLAKTPSFRFPLKELRLETSDLPPNNASLDELFFAVIPFRSLS